jgi:transposase
VDRVSDGLGWLLAQQLVAAGETVVDVPPTLTARARLLDAGSGSKTDRHDARSAAIVALRHRRLREVTALDYTAVLRLLADRQHDLVALRTQAVCRLHAVLCLLIPGGRSRRLSAATARAALDELGSLGLVDIERKALAIDLLADIDRLDDQIARLHKRIAAAVTTAATTVTDVYGVGPICAAIIVGTPVTSGASPPQGTSLATTPPHPSRPRQGHDPGTGSTHAATAD